MPNKVISIKPQLLCGKLARDLGRFLEGDPCASPEKMLEQCNEILTEIGASKDGNDEDVTR